MYSPVGRENEPLLKKIIEKKREIMLTSLVICGFIICSCVYTYASDSTRRWFRGCLSKELQQNVTLWTDSDLDRELYKYSRWDGFTPSEFKSFVFHQIHGLNLSSSESFHFLEAGVGVGAFAREILHMYPNSTGMGFDLEAEAVAIATLVLPHSRMQLFVGNMLDLSRYLEPDTFDHVLVPGSLCYLHNLMDVKNALQQFTAVLKTGGGLCASMLASTTSDTGSCNIRIPKSIWETLNQLQLVSMEEMDDWRLPHSGGRYAVCLRKRKK
jgi:SAM-dependent methyltransferase